MPASLLSLAAFASSVSAMTWARSAMRNRLISARSSPSTRTLGSQLEAISTVWALITCMLRIASRPMPDIATSMNAITAMTLARIESADMAGSLKRWRQAPRNYEGLPSIFDAPGISGNGTRQVPSDG